LVARIKETVKELQGNGKMEEDAIVYYWSISQVEILSAQTAYLYRWLVKCCLYLNSLTIVESTTSLRYEFLV
jgi:hypothetical protein